MIQRSIHYKSDFKLRLANEIDWSTPFKARFFTTRPVSAMEVSYDGTTYKGCRVDEEGKLVVTFDRFTQLHRQGLGNLMMELSYNIDDDQFADNSFDRILAPQKVVCTDDEDNEFELVLGLNGDSHVEVECSVIAAYKKGDPGDTPEIGENGNWWIGGVDTEVKADYSSEEALRQSQEAARVAAETSRQSNETQRQSGETTRQSNEATRQSKETERQTNETARQNAETQRQQTFQTNEAARQTAYQNAEANRNGAYQEAEQDRDEEFASKEATRDAANQAALNCADTLAALGPKINWLYDVQDFPSYKDDVLELWICNMPAGRLSLKCFGYGADSVAAYLTNIDANLFCRTVLPTKNNVAYPIKVYSGGTSQYPNDTIVAYVMFRDVDSFLSKIEASNLENVNRESRESIANSPLIAMQIGESFAQNSNNAKASLISANISAFVNPSISHSAFVKEFYMFGDGIDTTKTYRIYAVSRNNPTYKWSIVVTESGDTVSLCRIYGSPTLPENPILLSEVGNSGINAYAIVNWDAFDDGSNQAPNLVLSPRIFDLNYSPTVANYLRGTSIQNDILSVQGNISSIQDEVSLIQDTIQVLFTTSEYGRSDFKNGYAATNNASIGGTLTLPGDDSAVTSDSNAGHLTLQVKTGDIVKMYYKSTSNKYCRAWVLLDGNKKIIAWSNPQTNADSQETLNYLTTPLAMSIEQDGYLLIQFAKANYTDNADMSIEHKRLSNNEGDDDDDTITDYVDVCVPDTIHAVVGDTLQLYYHSIFRCVDYTKYDINVVCNIGAQYPRYYEVTPLANQVGSRTITFTIKDNNNNVLGTKSSSLVVHAAGSSPSSNINVLCVGASATVNGEWASELKRRLTGSGGTPSGSNFSNITFVGRMPVTKNGITVNLEATGGYSFNTYISTTTLRFKFNVTAANEPTIAVGDVYSINGNNYTIVEINITAGSGGYFSCDGSANPPNSGTLTKVSGSGSSSIIYSSSSRSGNPFVYDGDIDIEQYAEDYCNGQIDVIYTELFGNGSIAYLTDMTTRLSQMQTFINNILAVFPNCKFCIGLFWNPDLKGGMGVNYGASGGWSFGYGIKYTNMALCNALQEYITTHELTNKVFILNWLNEFDTENDMQQTTKIVNPRSSVTEIFGVNGVHPSNVGYNQMADTAWRLFVAKFCQS